MNKQPHDCQRARQHVALSSTRVLIEQDSWPEPAKALHRPRITGIESRAPYSTLRNCAYV